MMPALSLPDNPNVYYFARTFIRLGGSPSSGTGSIAAMKSNLHSLQQHQVGGSTSGLNMSATYSATAMAMMDSTDRK